MSEKIIIWENSLANKSSLPSSPSRSFAWIQITRANMREVIISCCQYLFLETRRSGKNLIPSIYRSYAVEERNVSAMATTKPIAMRSTLLIKPDSPGGDYELTANDQTNLVIQVINVAHPVMKSIGRIIFGKTDPRSLKKYGSGEYVLGSIGPDCYQQLFLRRVQNTLRYRNLLQVVLSLLFGIYQMAWFQETPWVEPPLSQTSLEPLHSSNNQRYENY